MQAAIASPSVASQERTEASHMVNHTHKKFTCKANGSDAFHDHPGNNTMVSDQGVSTQIAASDIQSISNNIPSREGPTSSPHSLGKTNNSSEHKTRSKLSFTSSSVTVKHADSVREHHDNQLSSDRKSREIRQASNPSKDRGATDSDDDIFEGVSYKRNARYYIAGIGPRSSQNGLMNFLRNRGVTVSHCVFFKQKRPGSRRNAKINVALRDAQTIESPSFWPYGITCRPWLSNRQWEAKIAQEQPEDDGSTENNDHDELDNHNVD